MKKLLAGLVGAAGGILCLFSFFAMWAGKVTVFGSTNTEFYGIFKFTGDNAGKIVTADIFALVAFIAGCLFAAVFLLNFLGILKGQNAKYGAFGTGALMILAGIMTIIFVIVASSSGGGDIIGGSFGPGYGGWITMIGSVVGGLAACYWGTLVKDKKKRK